MMVLPFIVFCITSLSFLGQLSIAVDTMAPNQTLADNGQTLVSKAQTFELGFFSPWNSNNRFIGIWFKTIPQRTIVWVANKNHPITDSSGVLTITATGNVVINRNTTILWSSNSSSTAASSPVLKLLDTGNLVVKNGGVDDNSGNYIWQSFDYPCDTLIPGMKLGWNLETGQDWYLTSWRSLQDPASGEYTYRVDLSGLPQLVLRRGSVITYRSGPWDGVRFSGAPLKLLELSVFQPIVTFDTSNAYYSFVNNDSMVSRFVVNQSGLLQHLTWSQRRNGWVVIFTLQGDYCDDYGVCGRNGICNINNQRNCKCPDGFTPRSPQDWNRFDWSGGCVPRTPLNCNAPAGFRKFSELKLPDKSYLFVNNTASNPVACEEACLRNCSCVAYAKTVISGCVAWFGNLLDIRQYSKDGQELYIRMPASELGSNNDAKRTVTIATASVISGVILLGLSSLYVLRKRTAKTRQGRRPNIQEDEKNLDLHVFSIGAIAEATHNFSLSNKIGEGGFGPVYKGALTTGQEIAVKRLSKDSQQGLSEFKTEVTLIAKLQHRNLVRLLGCCIHGEDRMLIYEYMSNGSLDSFIFARTGITVSNCLVWKRRFDIIVGIARGLIYLHQDSRLRIIHRDLKASNVLLDSEMNPKISDFGIARAFGGDQSLTKTKRVVGTYGYMSPEYAIDGLFSIKSDVFSFGVLVLEIVSGKRNSQFHHSDHHFNLLGHAWKFWTEGKATELIDRVMEDSFPISEVLRCIQIGLLCVQQLPKDRPTMSSVLLMLGSESAMLPQPNQPGFYTERSADNIESPLAEIIWTGNEVTNTLSGGR